jgi:hypothetical protein
LPLAKQSLLQFKSLLASAGQHLHGLLALFIPLVFLYGVFLKVYFLIFAFHLQLVAML